MAATGKNQLPEQVQVDGDETDPWWKSAVVYQIYPRSFRDQNGDGIGDIQGIISRLDYLKDLGVDVLWLSPVYKSPQVDYGYDISDYEAIDPMFGTMKDMDELLEGAHRRGMKVIMDLVVNHTSDEHPWFEASRDPNDPHADWYWWRPARPDMKPGTPGAEPNRWGGTFSGSAWTYDEKRGEYYLHLFTRQQPDLNWENPSVRHAVYDMMNWWMDRGIDGFRMDVITLISKTLDKNGKLPGEAGSLIEDGPVGETGFSDARPFVADGPRLDEFLREIRREVFDGREGFLTVGESNVTPERSVDITDPANRELDMLFVFDHLEGHDVPDGEKWSPEPLSLPKLKRAFAAQQQAVERRGWPTVFFDNHDQPRVVSRWGDDSSEEGRVASAKALALLLLTHRGTPYIYQGEELGMTNAHFTALEHYRDVESLEAYRERVEEQGLQSRESMMLALAKRSRDNARTPMQWSSHANAGFMIAGGDGATGLADEPWIPVNPNYRQVNAASQVDDPDSVYSFYKRLIALRQSDRALIAGSWNLLDAADPQVYAYTREIEGRRLLVVVNCSKRTAKLPSETKKALRAGKGVKASVPAADRFVIATEDVGAIRSALVMGGLAPWQGFVIEL